MLTEFLLTVGVAIAPLPPADAQPSWQQPPEPIASQLDVPRHPATYFSPNNQWMIHLDRPSYPPIAELTELRIQVAGLELNPQTHSSGRGYESWRGLSIQRLGASEQQSIALPENSRIRNWSWSLDSQYLAFNLIQSDGLELWVLHLEEGVARQLTEPILNDTYGSPCNWLPGEAGLMCKTVPDQGAAPEPSLVPTGPRIEENLGREAPARTFTNLLSNQDDEALFEYYLTSTLEHITLEGDRRPLTTPQLIHWASPSPDGSAILVSTIQRPFSYQVHVGRFPRKIEVLDLDGTVIQSIAQLPLADDVPTAAGSVRSGRRYVDWRSDRPATLYWVEALDGGDARRSVPKRDAVYQMEVMGTHLTEPKLLWTSEYRFNHILWGNGTLALAFEYWHNTRQLRTWQLRPDQPSVAPVLLNERDSQDAYNHPGYPVMAPGPYGWNTLLLAHNDSRKPDNGRNPNNGRNLDDGHNPNDTRDTHTLFLNGQGASPNGRFPFLDRWTLETGHVTRLWQAQAPYYERVVRLLDSQSQQLITSRQSRHTPPNYWIYEAIAPDSPLTSSRTPAAHTSAAHTSAAHTATPLTHHRDPLPWYADMQREIVTYERADGVTLSATLYLPPNFEVGVDAPLTTVLWVYPQEYKSRKVAGQRTQSDYVFSRPRSTSPLFLLSQGYAVLMNPRMPIIGEANAEPNDSYVEQLVMNAQAAVDYLTQSNISEPHRIAIAGHSYGAFTAANLLAHSDLFCAGIARNGAYNRTLTPFGFQGEQRNFWEAQDTYLHMSPFAHAMAIDEPLLLIHGAEDRNSGTYPMQSERLYEAMRGLGGTVRWVELPLEGHSYDSREAVGHVLWEMVNWLKQCS